MSTLTQRIPTLLLGISQQPDNLKFPGQVVDAENVFPDYALGMLKRPGGKFVANLEDASTSGKWFSILRDEREKYVAQYDTTTNSFKIWSLIDTTLGVAGSPRRVDMGTNTGVPGTCNQSTLQTTLTNYNTASTDRSNELTTLHGVAADYAEIDDGQPNPFTGSGVQHSLFKVTTKYDDNYTQSVATGITYDGTQYNVFDEDASFSNSYSSTSGFPSQYKLGADRTDEYPLLNRNGVKLFELLKTDAAVNTPAELATAASNLTTAEGNYTTEVGDETTKRGLYETARDACDITAVPSDAYLKDATADDIELLTINDYTFVLNKSKVTAMKTAPADLSDALPNQAFVVISVVAYNADYTVTINGTDYTYQTPQNTSSHHVDTDKIVSELVTAINAATGTHGVTASAVGPGIYLNGTSAFTVATTGSTSEEGLYVFQDEINVAGRLPNQCQNGYVVKVYNSDIVDADDMWVKFQTKDSATSGPGVWEETVGPELEYQLDELTMPHQLVRQADGSFKYEPVDWTDRLVGDNTTNPIPSFIGSAINNIFFYRNRLGFLSNENVILSKSGDYFNFFAGSAQIVAADDPIDLSATSQQPVNLAYVQTVSVGLVLFGQNEQFLMSTDADILSPTTAKINTVSNYECDEQLDAVSLGTSLGFISKTLLWTRVYELGDIRKEAPAETNELTNNVSELIPSTINSFICSPALSLLSFGEEGSDIIYQYRFYQPGKDRLANTWYKWKLTGKLLEQFFDETTFYSVCYDGTKVFVQSYDLTQSSEQGFLTLPTGEKTDVCLDLFTINPYRTYNSSTKTTRVFLPYDHIPGKKLQVLILGGYIGETITAEQSVGTIYPEDTPSGSAGNWYMDLDGDYRGRNLIIGYLFDMSLQLPVLYYGQTQNSQHVTDSTADLIIHRLKVNTGLSGPITYTVDITGLDEWENVVNVTLPNSYNLGNVNLAASAEHVIPIFQRNKNCKITIKGDTAFPVSLNSMSWEGNYNTRFYRRS
jgi:hypothetical protein